MELKKKYVRKSLKQFDNFELILGEKPPNV